MTQQKRIWVHIGLPKCGSTTIQGYFADNDAHYLKRGLCYPKSHRSEGGYRSHHPIVRADIAELPRIVADIKAEAEGAKDVLISCEDYTIHLSSGRGKALMDELRRAFPDDSITAVAYFRNIYEFIESAYAQFVMAGLYNVNRPRFFQRGTPNLRKFITRVEQAQGVRIDSILHYVESIKAAFPDTEILLRSLEKKDLDGAGIIEDICAVMGYTPLPMNKRRNTRASNRTIAAAQFLRTRLTDAEFLKVRKALRKLDLDSLAADPDALFRNREICIGGQFHDEIKARIEAEKDALPALFSTRVDALIEDRWKPLVPKSSLTPAMRKRVLNLAKRKLRQDGETA